MNTTLRIVRFSPADCGGHWISFASDDEYEFYRLVGEIKALGYAHAQWTPEPVKAWWLSPNGLARLCARNHDLAWLLGEFVRAEGRGSSDAGGASGGTSGKRKRASSSSGGNGGQRKTSGAKSAKASAVPADVQQALALLFLAPDAPVALVKVVHRTLAKACHPDKGGTTADMQRLNLAREVAEAWAATHGAQLAGVA